jgi:cysteine synthase A
MSLYTPLIKIQSLSDLTGCNIYGKAEFNQIGGSVKDRTAFGIIEDAEQKGLLKPGGTIVEGTAGNTGIGLAVFSAQRGYKCVVVMPDNQAEEKYAVLKALGVQLITVPPCPFANQNHFYHTARRFAEEHGGFWVNQFENPANFEIHYKTTGPEIFEQTNGKVDAFISAAGTGGTIAGVSQFLKEKNPKVHVRLVDPEGSGLFHFLKTGEFKSSGSSITEGIGIMRLTENFKRAKIDDAVQVSDQEMINMLYHLAHKDGLLVGTSSALNVHAAFKYAMENKGKGLTIVTVLCDSAMRYASKVFNEKFLHEKNLFVQWGPGDKADWLKEQSIKRSYKDEVLSKIEKLKSSLDVVQYGALSYDSDRYPLYLIKSKNFDKNKKTVLITGGVHGYETSGVHGALSFMEKEIKNYESKFNLICFPCISPWGYETINRWNPLAIDPNRSFRADSPAEECRHFLKAVNSLNVEIFAHFDLHETTDTDNTIFRPALASRDGKPQDNDEIPDGFYLVDDSSRARPEFQKAIIDSVRKVTHIAPPDQDGNIIGAPVEQEGVINYDMKKLSLCGGFSDAQYTTTTEVYPDSPKATDAICIEAQVAAIKGGLDFIV